ncbi:hypothetical protein AGRA3207_004459 [Actinomadura graeca]|uniref:DUF6879 domain-containing protein n=1 Tax=Actinomadura graeca TaxID=2750812 RepID=A0ABX8R2T7_9ACTN|nr:DUF6879 family protein [Actinomadura graeca]QXJ23318.1 hypothetical protein AGRA3207_004459 [Actinomadura graeca]
MTTVTTAAELLRTARFTAVHLEMRDVYAMDGEDEDFEEWRTGHRDDPADPDSWWRPWLTFVREATRRGVRVRRARIVSEPVSEYIRFEYDGTFTNIYAGEQVRWLPRRRASGLCLPGNDFWLFDGELVLWNHFDGDGRSQPKETTTDTIMVKTCSSAFEAVWERGVDHADYLPV